MDISKKNRSDLKSYFVTNAVPTETNFADLIDAGLNQREDGIVKQAGSPLSIEAVGDETSQKKALNIYEVFTDESPEWIVSLRPRVSPQSPTSARRGFSVSDSSGVSRLFIDRASGNVGVGLIEPTERLHVAGGARIDGKLRVGGGIESIDAGAPVLFPGDVNVAGTLTAQNLHVTNPVPQESWKPLALQNGWVRYSTAYNPVEYYKDSLGIVHLRGFIKSGKLGVPIFVLPEGYRPEYTEVFNLIIDGVAGRMDLGPNGEAKGVDVSPVWTSLDNLSFRAHH